MNERVKLLAERIVFLNPLWFWGAFFIFQLAIVQLVTLLGYFTVMVYSTVFLGMITIFQLIIPYATIIILLDNVENKNIYAPRYLNYYLGGGVTSLILWLMLNGHMLPLSPGNDLSRLVPVFAIAYFSFLIAIVRSCSWLLNKLSESYLGAKYHFWGALLCFIYFPVGLFFLQRRLRKLRLAGARI